MPISILIPLTFKGRLSEKDEEILRVIPSSPLGKNTIILTKQKLDYAQARIGQKLSPSLEKFLSSRFDIVKQLLVSFHESEDLEGL